MWGRERPHILADKNLGPFISYLQDCAYFGPYILYILVHFYFLYSKSFYLQIFTAIFSVSRVQLIKAVVIIFFYLHFFLLYHEFKQFSPAFLCKKKYEVICIFSFFKNKIKGKHIYKCYNSFGFLTR